MSSLMKMSRILGTLIIAALVVPAISSTMLVQNTYAFLNQAPALNPIGNKTVDEAQLLQFTVTATDPDSDNLTYSASNLPTGATFNVSIDFPTFSWIPGYDQAGDHEVQFEVSDGYLSASENITITVGQVNGPPVLDPIGDKTVNENELLTFDVLATDPNSDNLTYSASNLPTGATFNVSIDFPTFSWIPGYDQAGDHEVQFEVSDGYLSASENITITVGDVNREPVIGSVTADPDRLWPPNHKHVDVTIIMDATDPDGDGDIESATYTYSVTDEYGIYDVAETDLPEDGVISLVAERYGEDKDGRVYVITVTAYDAGGLSNSGSVEILVPHDQGKKSRTATAYRAGELSDGGSVDVVVPYGQSKKGKPGTTYDAGEVSQGGSGDMVIPPGHSKKDKNKKGKSGK